MGGWVRRVGVCALMVGFLLLSVLPARQAGAYVFWPVGAYPPLWFIMCEDGWNAILPISGPPFNLATALCMDHGGVAEITDVSVQTALSEIATCDAPSTFSVARDLGGGNWEALTEQDLVALVENAGGNPVELPDHRVVSVIVGGQELLPNPVPNLATIPIRAIYSDEQEDGQAVGGLTSPPFCGEVPIPRATVPLVALALAALGVATVARARRRV